MKDKLEEDSVDNQRKRERKITEIAGIQGISRVRVWQLYRHYIGEGEIPEFKKPGRKRRKI